MATQRTERVQTLEEIEDLLSATTPTASNVHKRNSNATFRRSPYTPEVYVHERAPRNKIGRDDPFFVELMPSRSNSTDAEDIHIMPGTQPPSSTMMDDLFRLPLLEEGHDVSPHTPTNPYDAFDMAVLVNSDPNPTEDLITFPSDTHEDKPVSPPQATSIIISCSGVLLHNGDDC